MKIEKSKGGLALIFSIEEGIRGMGRRKNAFIKLLEVGFIYGHDFVIEEVCSFAAIVIIKNSVLGVDAGNYDIHYNFDTNELTLLQDLN